MSNFELSLLFFLQLGAILVACRVVGMLAGWLGQPQVVGEMITGVLLGPSLLGQVAPDIQHLLFPKGSMSLLYTVSQLGLVLYMFVVGIEFQVTLITQRIRRAITISVAGILAPWLLGALIALALVTQRADMFAADVPVRVAILFLGAAMSVTAFPMLARIIHERGLTQTPLGTLVLAAGAIDDMAAWSVLAIVLASFSNDIVIAVAAIGGGLLYSLVVLGLLKPLWRRIERLAQRESTRNLAIAATLVLLMLGAWCTDRIGIYAVFGAFILGVSIPRGALTETLRRTIEPLTVNLLLPLFFIYSGLNTQIGLVATPALWGITALIILAASLGKGAACWAAAWMSGEPQRNALAVGALMNTRGMMELIMLNIGLERGIITPTLFTMMVLMAIATTLMTSPIFALVMGRTRLAPQLATAATS